MAVYKYLRSNFAFVLDKATLRATQANALNDPFELKPIFDAVLDRADVLSYLQRDGVLESAFREAYGKLPADRRAVLPFETFSQVFSHKGLAELVFGAIADEVMTHAAELTDHVRRWLYEDLGEKFGIVSFSEIASDVLMWSHYSEDHKGFVIQFDESHEFFDRRRSDKDEFYHLRKVFYSDAPEDHIKLKELDGVKLLCTKRPQWAYEREQRMVIPVDPKNYKGTGEPIHLINFPRDAVIGVIVGERASPELESDLRRIAGSHPEYSGINLQRARADVRSGSMVIEDFL